MMSVYFQGWYICLHLLIIIIIIILVVTFMQGIYICITETNYISRILCFVDRASLYYLCQIKPNRCTLLLSIFISTSLIPTSRPDSHPYTVKKYQCHIDAVSSPDDGHTVGQNM